MRFIQKVPTPLFFTADTQGLSNWNDYLASNRRILKEFILKEEQNYICCYCEKKIEVSSSHAEHLIPKSLDPISLTFSYDNISVSCEGVFKDNNQLEISRQSCGHKKDAKQRGGVNPFNSNLFLNPTIIQDISDYFIFDEATGVIAASSKDTNKAEYNIRLLNLNGLNNSLAEARKIKRESLIRTFSTIFPIELRKEKLKTWLEKEGNEYGTFLKFVFKDFLKS